MPTTLLRASRPLSAFAVVLLIAACSSTAAPTSSVAEPTADPIAEPTAEAEATDSPAASSSENQGVQAPAPPAIDIDAPEGLDVDSIAVAFGDCELFQSPDLVGWGCENEEWAVSLTTNDLALLVDSSPDGSISPTAQVRFATTVSEALGFVDPDTIADAIDELASAQINPDPLSAEPIPIGDGWQMYMVAVRSDQLDWSFVVVPPPDSP